MEKDTKSPLLSKPARLPGQSLEEEITRVRDTFLSERLVVPTIVTSIAIYDWVRWYTETPVNPLFTTLFAAAAIIWFFTQFISTLQKLTNLKLGRDGERAVGQFLERARKLGYHVFHDIQSNSANIDHLLVGPGGVYTVETKTYSKPAKGRAVINYDVGNEKLSTGGIDISRCLNQAKAQAGEIRALFDEYLSEPVYIQPVVVFPGWYIESTRRNHVSTWVLEPKAFMKWLDKSSSKLQPNAVKAAVQVINRHIVEK